MCRDELEPGIVLGNKGLHQSGRATWNCIQDLEELCLSMTE